MATVKKKRKYTRKPKAKLFWATCEDLGAIQGPFETEEMAQDSLINTEYKWVISKAVSTNRVPEEDIQWIKF